MREVSHTRTADGVYTAFVGTNSKNRTDLGTVTRSQEKVEGAGDDKVRSRTVYVFTPAAGIELSGMKAGTMKALKEDIGRNLPDLPPPADPLPTEE